MKEEEKKKKAYKQSKVFHTPVINHFLPSLSCPCISVEALIQDHSSYYPSYYFKPTKLQKYKKNNHPTT